MDTATAGGLLKLWLVSREGDDGGGAISREGEMGEGLLVGRETMGEGLLDKLTWQINWHLSSDW